MFNYKAVDLKSMKAISSLHLSNKAINSGTE